MNIALTWNLVLLAALVLFFAYNSLLGQNKTMKLTLSIYIAILTADGVAGILKRFVFDLSPGFQQLIGEDGSQVFTTLRIVLFLLAIVIFVVNGGFHIRLEKHDHWAIRTMIHATFSALSAILFLATLLIYLSGNSFVEGILQASQIMIYEESLIARILIDYYQIWFSLPAIGFLATSFLFEPDQEN